MSEGLTTLFGATGAVAALLAVLVPVILTQGKSLRREIYTLRGDLNGRMDRLDGRMDRMEGRLDRLSDDLHSLSDRVARIEGSLTGPWRPSNGSPAPTDAPPSTEPAS